MRGPLSQAELAHVLRGYGLPPHDDGEPPVVITARVLHLPSAGGGLAIKVFTPEAQTEAQTEASVLAYLGTGGPTHYRVAQLVRTTSGEALLELGARRVLVTRWEPGIHRSYREIDASGWAVLGRALAAVHVGLDEAPALPLRSLVAELRERDLDHDRRILDEHRRLANASDRPTAALVGRLLADRSVLLERHAMRCLARLPPGDDRPIHNDYNVHNWLFHERGPFHEHGPPTILDWERAIHAPREYELCRCLVHLPLVAPRSAWSLVQGYLQGRTLDPELVGWAIDAAVSTHALKHWPVELWLAGAPGADERIPGLAEIVRSFVEEAPRLEAFAGELQARIRERKAP